MPKYNATCSDCGADFTLIFKPNPALSHYCDACFFKNFNFKNDDYALKFVSALDKQFTAANRPGKFLYARDGFVYQIIKTEDKKKPTFACTITLSLLEEPKSTAKFLVSFSTKGTEFQGLNTFIRDYCKAVGVETDIPLVGKRKF